jgi:hypothetical protein
MQFAGIHGALAILHLLSHADRRRMVALLLVWAACGIPIAFVVGSTPTESPREWVDASGTKRAQATFVRVDGDTVWLRRADGKLVITTLSNLSKRDRLYVATRTPAADSPTAAAASKPMVDDSTPQSPVEAAVEEVTEHVETIRTLPEWVGQTQLGEPSPVPAAIVYVRVSRNFLEDYVERNVSRRKPVRDCILGATIRGYSDTIGKTRLSLLPSNERLIARIAFDGTVRARTRGYKGPVVIHSLSDSKFHAHKRIELDGSGLRVWPAKAAAPTRLQTLGIDTHLPRLRGRIARRIASRRAAQSHGAAEAITADHTADDIRGDFEARVNRSMANVQRVLGSKIPDLETATSPMPTDVRFRSRPESVEVAIIREDATAAERKLRPPSAKPSADVSLRVHRTLFTSAIEDPQLLTDLSPLFNQLLEARAKQSASVKTARTGSTTTAMQDPNVKWSMEAGWLVMDFTKPSATDVGNTSRVGGPAKPLD